VVPFLSKAEKDYLLIATGGEDNNQKTNNNHNYYCVKSRLQKKLRQFTKEELPLLLQHGYLAEFCKLAENCNIIQTKQLLGGRATSANTERGSPSLVGRGIANPMSERTRGFEIPFPSSPPS
jgi:hypothetical protein